MDAVNQALAPVLIFLRQQPGIAVLSLLAVLFGLLAATIVQSLRLGRVVRRQSRILRGVDGGSLEKLLLDYASHSAQLRETLETARQRGLSNADSLEGCVQKIGVVRYDALSDVGGRQSFSVALLDAKDSGIVLSGLFSRQDMRVYTKTVFQGQGESNLTDEERQAIADARRPSERRP
jgi:hypothetical protein